MPPLKRIKKIKKKSRKLRKLRKRSYSPTTRHTVGKSKLEGKFKQYLEELGFEVETQFPLQYKFYDFKIKGKNVLVELDGDYYHCNSELYPKGPINSMQRKAIINDKKKNYIAMANGFTLIRIWESDFNNKEPEVRKKLTLLL